LSGLQQTGDSALRNAEPECRDRGQIHDRRDLPPSDPAEREAYLKRLWAFVSRLNPANNSLKAHALYRRLVLIAAAWIGIGWLARLWLRKREGAAP